MNIVMTRHTWANFLLRNARWMTCSVATTWAPISSLNIFVCYFLLLCIPLCCAITSSHRQSIHIPNNWLSQERWLLQINLQSRYWISCPFKCTLVHKCTGIALCVLTYESMWTWIHILSAHNLILPHLFSLLFLPVIFKGLLSSLLIDS